MSRDTHLGYACPVCGTDPDDERSQADFMPDYEGVERWFYRCYKCHGQGLDGGEYLAALADALDVTFATLQYRGPERAGLLCEPTGPADPPEPLPDLSVLRHGAEALLADRAAMRWLRRERGLRRATVERFGLGRCHEGVAFPVYEGGALVNVRTRGWPHPMYRAGRSVKIAGLRGRGSQLYPGVPPGPALLVCEGELDALLARQAGFPAVTSTAGQSWQSEWDAAVRGRLVAVAYDADAADSAKRRAAKLAAAGAREAWPVDLRAAGLTGKEDLTDLLLGAGAHELRRLIRDCREAAATVLHSN